MKVLTICRRGNVRSATLATLLKDQLGYDALAVGFAANSEETITMLCEWADLIIAMDRESLSHLREQYQAKIGLCDVGEDVWLMPMHPDLVARLQGFVYSFTIAP